MPIYYVATCSDTDRLFLCEAGAAGNVAELEPQTIRAIDQRHGEESGLFVSREAMLAAVEYLDSLLKNDGSDDDHPARSINSELCRALDMIGWKHPARK